MNKLVEDDDFSSSSFAVEGKLAMSGSTHTVEDHKEPIYCVAWSDDMFVVGDADDDEINIDSSTEARESLPAYIGTETPTISTAVVGESSPDQPHANRQDKRAIKSRYYRCFASCVNRQVTVYEVEVPYVGQTKDKCNPNLKSGPFIVKQCYVDPDENEEYYACVFGGRSVGEPFGFYPHSVSGASTSINTATDDRLFKKQKIDSDEKSDHFAEATSTHPDDQKSDRRNETNEEASARMNLDPGYLPCGPQLLCVGGKAFSIKVIDTTRKKCLMTLAGHGEELSALKLCPIDEWILLSTSFDRSCRLWNLRNGSCIAIFTGHEGHRDIVMTGAWHPLGNKIISGGHDNLIKIWDVGEDTKVGEAIRKSFSVKLKAKKTADANFQVEAKTYFKPVIVQFPIFSTGNVHFQPVDCVDFIGDLVLSKANNIMILWSPDYTIKGESLGINHVPPSNVFVLNEYKVAGAVDNFMYYRFSVANSKKDWAVGNTNGDVLVWSDDELNKRHSLTLSVARKTIIRMTAFSPDDRQLLCCCEDGGVWLWDLYRRKSTKATRQEISTTT